MTTKVEAYIAENFEQLDKFSRVVAKVHGKNHPELLEVRELFLAIKEKVDMQDTADFTPELSRLKVITNDYQTPVDGCQTYQKTYQLLSEFDRLNV